MKLNIFWVLSFLFSFTFNVSAQLDDFDQTGGWANGRMWEKMDLQLQIMFLYGIESGISLLLDDLDNLNDKKYSTIKKKYFMGGFNFSEIANQVNLIYSDRANIRIPIPHIYVYTIKKLRGASTKELEDELVLLRKLWNNAAD